MKTIALKKCCGRSLRGLSLVRFAHNNKTVTKQRTFLSKRLNPFHRPTVWHEFSPLAEQYQSINLGQGFPDWDTLPLVKEAFRQAIAENHNQYTRSAAHVPLAFVLADIYRQRWNTEVDPMTQIATAVGATNVLFCALQGLLNPGDEVILLEPAFDIYTSQVRLAGGVPVYVPLHMQKEGTTASQVFSLNIDELESAITAQTKAMILNTPHNPTGKVFNENEMKAIAKIMSEHNVIVITDEVYEHIVFHDDEPHLSMANYLPDLTLTISSAGKTFSATGWKIGWAVGPPYLVGPVASMQQWVNFSTPTPNQQAIAQCLIQAEVENFTDCATEKSFSNYYSYLATEYRRKRDLLSSALVQANMTPIPPSGGFFIMADTTNVDFPYENYKTIKTAAMPLDVMPRDWALSRWLTETVGVTAIPPSAFYSSDPSLGANLLRFAFCKTDETIMAADNRFREHFSKRQQGH